MSYIRPFVARWTRRDRLAILVVAATMVFLTGTTVLGLAVASQTTTIAAEYESGGAVTYHESPPEAAATDGIVLPVSEARIGESRAVIIGVPPDVPAIETTTQTVDVRGGDPGVLMSPTAVPAAQKTIQGPAGTTDVRIDQGSTSPLFPDAWYVTAPETVEELGATGAFVLSPTASGDSGSEGQIPFVGALRFFVLSTGQLAQFLQLATIASGALVAVTIYSVTSITVADRATAIRVVRSTGGSRRRISALFAARAGLLTLVGVALGYAGGLVLARGVVNGAVFVGVPTSLNLHLSGRAAGIVVTAVGGLVATGVGAGWLAARRSVRGSPIEGGSSRPDTTPFGRRLRPTVLSWDALVPSATTLTVFVAFALLIAAVGTTVAPIAAEDQQTITDSEAVHPVGSTVPEVYASTLRTQGATASPEILLFLARGNDPIIARGVNVSAYMDLTGAHLVEGTAPTGQREALVGRDLAAALDVDVGETITVGGSTNPALARLEVVGLYAGDGPEDDQLLVSLDTARRLSGKTDGTVQFIRVAGGSYENTANATTLLVTDIATQRSTNGTVVVRVSATNVGLSTTDRDIVVELDGRTQPLRLEAASGRSTTGTVTFRDVTPGRYTVRAGNVTETASLTTANSSGTLSISGLPTTIPPDSTPLVRITRGGTPVANATVRVADRQVRTGSNGSVRLPFEEPGAYDIEATAGGASTTQSVTVSESASQRLAVSVRVDPAAPTIFTQPTVTVSLWNPWEETIEAPVLIRSRDTTRTVNASVSPGETARFQIGLPRRPAGRYSVQTQIDGETVEATYRVTGDERLATALASSGRRTEGGGISQALNLVIGNLQVVLGTLIGLAGVMVIGGTTAAFARSIAATRREIGIRRAVGARPRDVYRLILTDAIRVGGLATLGATVVASLTVAGLLALGGLRLFGVSLRPEFSPLLIGGVLLAGCTLALMSAGLAALPLVRQSPASLLRDRTSHYTQEVNDAEA